MSAGAPNAAALFHGAAWRALSLASKLGFLVVVVPRTIPGDYGLFFSYSSLGLLLSRVISFGAIDHLPTKVRGDPTAMRRAVRDLTPLSVLAVIVTAVSAATDSLHAAGLALALSMASGLMLAGAVRSVGPALFERWLNLHPILFLLIAFLVGPGVSARQLLLAQSVAILLSQLILLRLAVVGDVDRRVLGGRQWWRRLADLLAGGQSRMASDVLVAGCIRGVAIGPVLFGLGAISDSMALALALGEAVWTVGMILVHRNFAFYCATGPDLRHSLLSASLLLAVIAAAGAVGAWLAGEVLPAPMFERVELAPLVAAFLLFSGFAALSELRYFDLASGRPLRPWVVGQIAFLSVAASAPYLLGEVRAVLLLAGLATVLSIALVLSRLGRRQGA